MTMQQNYGGGYAMPAPAPLSKAALTSMILGILFCVPLTSLLAVGFAIKGFSATKNNARRGRGFAIAGLVLGILGTVGWGMTAWGVAWMVKESAVPRQIVRDFARDVAANKIAAAQAVCDPSITEPDLIDLHRNFTSYGTYTDLTTWSFQIQSSMGTTTCQLVGVADFGRVNRPFEARLEKDATGTWKITYFDVK